MNSTTTGALDISFANFMKLKLRILSTTLKRICMQKFKLWKAVCEFDNVIASCSCFSHCCQAVRVAVVAVKKTDIPAGQ